MTTSTGVHESGSGVGWTHGIARPLRKTSAVPRDLPRRAGLSNRTPSRLLAGEGVLREWLSRAMGVRPGAAIELAMPSGRRWRLGDGAAQVQLGFRSEGALRRTLKGGFFGFAEAYTAGEIEVDGDWDRLFELGFCTEFARFAERPLSRWWTRWRQLADRPTLGGARRNAAWHYDFGNDFYRLWLDETMTYSCAHFANSDATLEQAQSAKLELICRKLALRPGLRLLDVGCGWGSLLIHAARHHGVRGVGCTLSRQQAALATERVAAAGLKRCIEIRLADYREISERFDRWVSVGMFEHVGKNYIGDFLEHATRQLRVGGLGLLHSIGKNRPTGSDLWIATRIFPGGYLPTLTETVGAMGRCGLDVLDVEDLRNHYPRTLEAWRRRFESHVPEIEAMTGPRFVRLWRLYLNASKAAFRYGENRVFQVLFDHAAARSLDVDRASWYEGLVPARVAASLLHTSP
jgi:cyclopropane-fatty-acyl-phospholipid synthase